MTPTNIPITAWEQAGIVVLFSLLLLAFIGAFFALARSILKTIQDISGQFQKFISDRDAQWQEYFENREQSFKERNSEIVKVLQSLVEKFDLHATETTMAITRMEERTANEPKTQPRGRAK